MAQWQFADGSAIERVEYLTSTNGHHEYREKPLPVYAVTFREPAHATVYVAAPLGTMQMIRTDPWRIFDLLWMLHTMDYEGRDTRNAGPHQQFYSPCLFGAGIANHLVRVCPRRRPDCILSRRPAFGGSQYRALNLFRLLFELIFT